MAHKIECRRLGGDWAVVATVGDKRLGVMFPAEQAETKNEAIALAAPRIDAWIKEGAPR